MKGRFFFNFQFLSPCAARKLGGRRWLTVEFTRSFTGANAFHLPHKARKTRDTPESCWGSIGLTRHSDYGLALEWSSDHLKEYTVHRKLCFPFLFPEALSVCVARACVCVCVLRRYCARRLTFGSLALDKFCLKDRHRSSRCMRSRLVNFGTREGVAGIN